MKVYSSLQKCRVELQKKNLKKSGHNKFAGYTYYELADVLPTINQLMLENNLCSFVNFNNEIATLTIVSIEDNSTITFTSPMSSASLKGCHDVQNLGAVQTYIRRYLYTNAFEIVESDALDSTQGRDEEPRKLSDKQINRLLAIAKKKGFDIAAVKKKSIASYKKSKLEDLTKNEYDEIVNVLEKLEDK